MKFEYEAVPIGRRGWGNPLKGKHRGIVEAPTGELAILKLFQQKLYPLSLKSMSQKDITVATRLANYKKMKAVLTGATPVSSPAPRFRIPWQTLGYYLAWGLGAGVLLWVLSRT